MLDRLSWLDLQGHLNTVCQLTILAILIFPKVCKTELLSLLASLVFIDDSSNGVTSFVIDERSTSFQTNKSLAQKVELGAI